MGEQLDADGGLSGRTAAADTGGVGGKAAGSPGSKSNERQDAAPVRIFNPATIAKPTPGYSQVPEISRGKVVFIAGPVALHRSGNLVGKDDFSAQVQQVFENLKAEVEASGGDLKSGEAELLLRGEGGPGTDSSGARDSRQICAYGCIR